MVVSKPNIQAIFNEALTRVSDAERSQYLDEVCGSDPELRRRIEALLLAHSEAGHFLGGKSPEALATEIRPLTEQPGDVIGPYKLLEQIGEGGMGVVYLALQTEPVERHVALKIIKPGMDTRQVIARFEAERQALALMDHPHIAKVLDAGTTDSGRPYFVMELVKGIPMTDYCDEQHLTPRERLELFIPICQAVQHAHQKGIIHRDLKPTNILVAQYDGRPVPKVIDFGVAKAINQKLTEKTMFTQHGQIVGTLEYMSPEQARFNQLDVDTRSDVYSLGVLLYELLTGETPFDKNRLRSAAFDELLRIIQDEEPPRPSTKLSSSRMLASVAANRQIEPKKLSLLVRGELDWIVMKALEKDRGRRYETANAFAQDVQHYLSDEPVAACPPSAAYRLRKFVHRNKLVLVTISLVSLALVAGTLISTWQAIRARKAETLAQDRLRDVEEARAAAVTNLQKAQEAEQLAQARLKSYEEAKTEALANLQKARDAVDRMLTRAAEELKYTPGTKAMRKDLLEDALEFYQGVLDQKSNDPTLHFEAAKAWFRMGIIYESLEQHTPANQAFEKSIEMLEILVAKFSENPAYRAALAESHLVLGSTLGSKQFRREESDTHLALAVRLAKPLVEEHPETLSYRITLADGLRQLGNARFTLGRPQEAEKLLRRSLAVVHERSADGASDDLVSIEARGLLDLARIMARTGSGNPESTYREALAIRMSQVAITPHRGHAQHAAWTLTELGQFLYQNARLAEAEQCFRQALSLQENLISKSPSVQRCSATTNSYLQLGRLLEKTGRAGEAEEAYRRGWKISTAQLEAEAEPPPYWFDRVQSVESSRVRLLAAAGRTDDIEAHYRQALAFWQKLADQNPAVKGYQKRLSETRRLLAEFLQANHRPAVAEDLMNTPLP